mmetsp:Transcript_5142/g.9013  ORF Transcript_5142/g.9013 Transcript_5142/m.9013 type:complete len:202 (+) Transcript_5142:93-698(+)
MSATVKVDVFHTGLEMNLPELRFQADKTIGEVKENLYRRTGTAPESMELWLVDGLDRKRQLLDKGECPISKVFPPEAEGGGWKLHIVDTNENSLSASKVLVEGDVPKYEAPHGRKDFSSFRNKRRSEESKAAPLPTSTTGMAEAAEFEEGDRVVTLKDGLKGTIRYIGKCSVAAPGFFVGVELDEAKVSNFADLLLIDGLH